MQWRQPFVQTGNDSLTESTRADDVPTPFLDAPSAAKWVGFGAFMVIFILVMMMIIRGRVVKPAQRKALKKSEYFEPAGQNAEIYFDDEPFPSDDFADETQDETAPFDDEFPDHDEFADVTVIDSPPQPSTPEKKRGPFAGLFGSKKKETTQLEPMEPEFDENAARDVEFYDDPADDGFEPHFDDGNEVANDDVREPLIRVIDDDVEKRRRLEEERDRQRREAAARLEAEEKRRREEESRAQENARQRREEEERRRHEERAAQQRIDEDRRGEIARIAALKQREHADRIEENGEKLSAIEEKLHHTSFNLRADLDRLQDSLGASLDERFEAFSRELQSRLTDGERRQSVSSADEHPVVSEAYFSEFADLLTEQISSLRDSVFSAIEKLGENLKERGEPPNADYSGIARKVDRLNSLLSERYAGGASAPVQLNDILADALPANRYAIKAKLSNGRSADALIALPGSETGLAIDARFPIDAFEDYRRDHLQAGKGVQSENEFRRIVLRHIVDVSERLIVDGQTVDSAIMFVPSESVFSQIHADFPDLVQESYRARVWMAAPTSLMATLHTVSAIASDHLPLPTDNEIVKELRWLRNRIDALENSRHSAVKQLRDDFEVDERRGTEMVAVDQPDLLDATSGYPDLEAEMREQAELQKRAEEIRRFSHYPVGKDDKPLSSPINVRDGDLDGDDGPDTLHDDYRPPFPLR